MGLTAGGRTETRSLPSNSQENTKLFFHHREMSKARARKSSEGKKAKAVGLWRQPTKGKRNSLIQLAKTFVSKTNKTRVAPNHGPGQNSEVPGKSVSKAASRRKVV